jgi:hypothetical protein
MGETLGANGPVASSAVAQLDVVFRNVECRVVIAPRVAGELPEFDEDYRDLVDALSASAFVVDVLEPPPPSGGLRGASADIAVYLLDRIVDGTLDAIVAGIVGTIGRRFTRARRPHTTHVVIFGPDERPLRRIEMPAGRDEPVIVHEDP